MVSSGLLRREALVRTDVSEEPGASFISVTKIVELGITQAVTSNRRTSVASCSLCTLLVYAACVRCEEIIYSQRTSVASCSLCCS
jgi:hypothetical protein